MPTKTELEFLKNYGFEKNNGHISPNTWMAIVKSESGSRFPHGRIFNVVVAAVGGPLIACSSRIWFEATETITGKDWDVSFFVMYEKDGDSHIIKSQMGGEDLLQSMIQAAAILEIPPEFEETGLEENSENEEPPSSLKKSCPNYYPCCPHPNYYPYPCCPQMPDGGFNRMPPTWREPPKFGDDPGWWFYQPTCSDQTFTVSATTSSNQ